MSARRCVCLLLCVLSVGCGAAVSPDGDVPASARGSNTPGPDEDPGAAPAAPLGEGADGAAVAAPIAIPDFTADQGADFNDPLTRADIEVPIRTACGDDTLCLNYEGVPDAEEGGRPCIIAATPSGTAERGSTITFLLEALCAAPSADGEPSPGEDEETSESGTARAS